MKRFRVDVCRTGFGFRTLEVDADTAEEAKKIAEDVAGNHEFSEKDANYEATDVEEVHEVTKAA